MVLAYHEVTPVAESAYSVSCDLMDEHLRLVALTNQASRDLGGTTRSLAVTFDDGEESAFRYGLPLLEKHAVKACFFVNVGFLGQGRSIKGWIQRFMDWPDLKELVQLGHSVQSHGWSHEFLTTCSPKELDNQLIRSKKTLEDRLGTIVDSISVPGGRWNAKVLDGCKRAGYTRVYTSDPWSSERSQNGIKVRGRFMVLRTTTPDALQHLLELGDLGRFRMRLQGQVKSSVRALLGERMYHSLWRRFMRTGAGPEISA